MQKEVALVGAPNVGKSVVFNYLTGRYANVSNYPGTTVEIARGRCLIQGKSYEIIDTPGLYSLLSLTEEERVTRAVLFRKKPEVVVQVADARNLRRMLDLTLQLLDGGMPVILTLNLMDEAAAAGIRINHVLLAELLGLPVVPTTAVRKAGLETLKGTIAAYQNRKAGPPEYSPDVEQAITAISGKLSGEYQVAKRMIALLLLQGDETALALVKEEADASLIMAALEKTVKDFSQPFVYIIARERQAIIDKVLAAAVRYGRPSRRPVAKILDRLTREPLTGIPLLLLVLYYGIYQFVGVFGAGVLVDYINEVLFGEMLTPAVTGAARRYLPWEWLQSVLVGDYGLFSLGIRYAMAIILPITGTFFLVFAILEDCGYLPRLAMLVDGLFKRIGLNGRAVIPVILGLGCGTMAVFATRTLETRRERLLATFLLSLAIPCSAQLGVVLAVLSRDGLMLTVWALYIMLVFVVTGWLSAILLPGRRSPFYMELPPLRLPVISNVIMKVYARVVLYFAQIIPIFIFASLFMWLGDYTGILAYIINAMEPLMELIGLPAAAAKIFLLGFFRRDYGAAGLYDLSGDGFLSGQQLLVIAVTLTLFVPCVAQLLVMVRERGAFAASMMAGIIAAISFASGWLVFRLAPALFGYPGS